MKRVRFDELDPDLQTQQILAYIIGFGTGILAIYLFFTGWSAKLALEDRYGDYAASWKLEEYTSATLRMGFAWVVAIGGWCATYFWERSIYARVAQRKQEKASTRHDVRCTTCGGTLTAVDKFCNKCGTEVKRNRPSTERYCSCGAVLSAEGDFCPKCGKKAEPPKPIVKLLCENCFTELQEGTVFCPKCGTNVPTQVEERYSVEKVYLVEDANTNEIECPICGMKQRTDRSVCWKCGVKFEKMPPQ